MKAKAFLFSITRMAGPPAGLEESCSPHVRRGAREAFGWRKRLDRWYAPLKPRAKPITAARELYKAAPPPLAWIFPTLIRSPRQQAQMRTSGTTSTDDTPSFGSHRTLARAY